MDKLYTSKQIAEIYGVPATTITQNWGKKGLKHIRGAGNSYLYQKVWVDEFLQTQIIQKNVEKEVKTSSISKFKTSKRKSNTQFVV